MIQCFQVLISGLNDGWILNDTYKWVFLERSCKAAACSRGVKMKDDNVKGYNRDNIKNKPIRGHGKNMPYLNRH